MEGSNNFNKSQDYIQSLEKGLNVIQAFSEETQTLTISEAARVTGLSRPTARRILLTLEHLGFAKSMNGVYSLTAHTLTLGYAYLSSQNIWNIAHPFMRDFVVETGESSSIAVLDGTDIIYVARVPTKRIMTINLNVGSRLPAYATSMGHVLLAHLSQDGFNQFLDNATFDKYTDNTITTQEELIENLNHVRERGWALVEQQLEEGLRSIAVPIKNTDGKVIAAINCSAHAGRISKETLKEAYLPLLLTAADKISKGISSFSQY
ncbi:IclR family transcriptional regulator domain-containing protein [Tuberibacillus sp. Marseille-P3662]|uniref:IclR family transcriptional regulator domain-containing protein n=1 Tax=Tuberibacillus sp. Marseille-P3662 TaxID=1965358 RepID=UPI000A1CC5C3|nr:IclR family transcriptional regulator C-terminal domain-containing protein [Tuberibacillus sp. Marseille-P3662]